MGHEAALAIPRVDDEEDVLEPRPPVGRHDANTRDVGPWDMLAQISRRTRDSDVIDRQVLGRNALAFWLDKDRDRAGHEAHGEERRRIPWDAVAQGKAEKHETAAHDGGERAVPAPARFQRR